MAMTPEDRLDVFDLIARYSWAYDCGDAEAYASVFAEDGVLTNEDDVHAAGRPAIQEAIKGFFALRGANVWQHHHDNLRIIGDGGACEVYAYWAVIERRPDGGCGVSSLGWCRTRCVKRDARWLIAERCFHMDLPEALPPAIQQI